MATVVFVAHLHAQLGWFAEEFSDLVFVGLTCGERVDFAFAFEEHGVLSDYAAEFLVGWGVYDEHTALLSDKVVVYIKGFVGF
jgi:hypothetical protein